MLHGPVSIFLILMSYCWSCKYIYYNSKVKDLFFKACKRHVRCSLTLTFSLFQSGHRLNKRGMTGFVKILANNRWWEVGTRRRWISERTKKSMVHSTPHFLRQSNVKVTNVYILHYKSKIERDAIGLNLMNGRLPSVRKPEIFQQSWLGFSFLLQIRSSGRVGVL